jgi:hypothetical protein
MELPPSIQTTVYRLEAKKAVRDIFKDDPFWVSGLRASVRINKWVKAFPVRKTLF